MASKDLAVPAMPQHLVALEQANRVRLARAELKRRVAEGEVPAAEVIAEVPWEAASMTISDLLMCQHRWGRTRTRRFLGSIPMGETKQLQTMTPRQRTELVERLSGRTWVAGQGWMVA